MTKTPSPPPTALDTHRMELEIRAALRRAGIALDLPHAAALLTIAVDHFADHPILEFLALCNRLHGCGAMALSAGALCPRCRAELATRDGVQPPCEWCA